jgi:hypothetical protein
MIDTPIRTSTAGAGMCKSKQLLAALLMYGKWPATPNSPRWVSFMVPEDFLEQVQDVLAEELEEWRLLR